MQRERETHEAYLRATPARLSWHTGAPIRPLRREEPTPLLFRDLGVAATRAFLEGRLQRLAGPLSPLTYLRSAAYEEPYVDHAHIGRLVLYPGALAPYRVGDGPVYVSPAGAAPSVAHLAWVPGDCPLAQAAVMLAGVRRPEEHAEVFGGARLHAAARGAAIAALTDLEETLARVERGAEPLRRRLCARDPATRTAARAELSRRGLDEEALCAAWHHLPGETRRRLVESLTP